MFDPVVTRDPTAVQVEVQKAYLGMFPGGENLFVPRVFGWAIECFTGHYPDYLAVDARYHDFEHTLQGTLCLARLLACRHATGAKPVVTEKHFQLAIIGVLLHDTGYLKRRDDVDGTGAKYTATHVHRSADFALRLLAAKGYSREEIASVQNMIRCTGVDSMLHEIPFQSKVEEVLGHALGTADLLGQMAAEDYVEKLPVLYAEFVEAARHDRGHTDFISKFGGAHDLMQRTPSFWQDYVKLKLDRDFDGLHRYLNQPYPGGRNWYVDSIEANMERLKEQLAAKV